MAVRGRKIVDDLVLGILERDGDTGHLVRQERLHGEELAGVDLGQESGKAEVRRFEPEGVIERVLDGVDAGLPCPGRAL